ncbi:MAG: hypothetical protein ACE366_11980 [Bradymonadia bacterium]
MSLHIKSLSEEAVLQCAAHSEMLDPRDLHAWQRDGGEAVALGAYEDDQLVGVLLARTGLEGTLCTTLTVDDPGGTHVTPYSLLLALAESLPEAVKSHCQFVLRRADLSVRQAIEMFGGWPRSPQAGEDPDAWCAALSEERIERCRTPVKSMLG